MSPSISHSAEVDIVEGDGFRRTAREGVLNNAIRVFEGDTLLYALPILAKLKG
jgi:hypothetical protein